MTRVYDSNLPKPPAPARASLTRKLSGFARSPRAWAIGGVIACGLAIGAGELALAAGVDHAGWDRGIRMAFLQHGVVRALDSVGASSQQEAAIHDIIAAKFTELAPDPKERDALRKLALDILGAPTIDRAAVEKFRADMIARFDAKSKVLVDGILQVADQLKPEQRAELTAVLAVMPPGGPMGLDGPPRDHHWRPDGNDDGPDKD